MASKSSYRPRRTRIYGANYDIGESYYKKQLEGIDNKYSSNSRFGSEGPLARLSSLRDERPTPEVTFRHDVGGDDEDFFKPAPRKSILSKLRDNFDDDLGESTYRPFSGTASKLDALEDQKFGAETRSDIHSRVRSLLNKERSPFLNDLETQGAEEYSTARRLKVRSQNVLMESSNESSMAAEEASSRARATKARLANLESEMLNITEKQAERENRSKSLRKLLNESDSIF